MKRVIRDGSEREPHTVRVSVRLSFPEEPFTSVRVGRAEVESYAAALDYLRDTLVDLRADLENVQISAVIFPSRLG